MGFYARHLAPHLADIVCRRADLAAERAALLGAAHGVVVEIGIGGGLNLTHYDAARVTRVVGVDPGEGFVAVGRARFATSPVPVTVVAAPAEALPLPDGAADCVVSTFTLCSVSDPAQALCEARRVLRPGGRLLFLEHGRAPRPATARWQGRLNALWRPLACGCTLDRDPPALIAAAGFTIEALTQFVLPGAPTLLGYLSRGMARRD